MSPRVIEDGYNTVRLVPSCGISWLCLVQRAETSSKLLEFLVQLSDQHQECFRPLRLDILQNPGNRLFEVPASLRQCQPTFEKQPSNLIHNGSPSHDPAFPDTVRPGWRWTAYVHFRLRQQIELDAMKLFLLFVARRERNSNLAIIGYDKIEEYTDIHRDRIKAASSLLVTNQLILTENIPSPTDPRRIANAYRIVGLDPYNHRGTRGR